MSLLNPSHSDLHHPDFHPSHPGPDSAAPDPSLPPSELSALYDKAVQATHQFQAKSIAFQDMRHLWDLFYEKAETVMDEADLAYEVVQGVKKKDEGQAPKPLEHAVLTEDVEVAGVKRRAGDALCGRAEEFGLLESVALERPPNCVACLEAAQAIARDRHPA